MARATATGLNIGVRAAFFGVANRRLVPPLAQEKCSENRRGPAAHEGAKDGHRTSEGDERPHEGNCKDATDQSVKRRYSQDGPQRLHRSGVSLRRCRASQQFVRSQAISMASFELNGFKSRRTRSGRARRFIMSFQE